MKNLLDMLKDPETCARSLRERVPGYIRLTFCAAVLLGFGTHLYMFTNKFANLDDLPSMFFTGYGIQSGRWLLPAAAGLDGDFSYPWLIGVLSVLCLAGAACFSVSLLRIRRPLSCILAAALVVTFPASADTLAFMFTADAYFLSFLLAAFGAWAAVRWGWWGSAAGAAAITLSLGIYQAYFPVAAVLMVGALLLGTLDGEKTFKELFLKGLRLVGTLAAGMAVYLIIVKITTRGVPLTDYKGLADMGQISLRELPGMICSAYKEYYRFFLRDDLNFHAGFWWIAIVLVGLGSLAAGIALLWKKKLGPARTALALLLAAIYPLAGSLLTVMGVQGKLTVRMLYGLLYILLLPIGLVEHTADSLGQGRTRVFHAGLSWVVTVTMLTAAWNYALVDNSAYLKADFTMHQCEAYSNRLLERIESCEGYGPWLDVVLVGSDRWTWDLNIMPQMEDIHIYGVMNLPDLRLTYSYDHFLHYFLGFPAVVYLGDSEEAKTIEKTEELKQMSLYPQSGSVKLLHYEPDDKDMIVVRLG